MAVCHVHGVMRVETGRLNLPTRVLPVRSDAYGRMRPLVAIEGRGWTRSGRMGVRPPPPVALRLQACCRLIRSNQQVSGMQGFISALQLRSVLVPKGNAREMLRCTRGAVADGRLGLA